MDSQVSKEENQVLKGFTGFTGFRRVSTEFYRVLPSFTEFYRPAFVSNWIFTAEDGGRR